MTGKSYKSWQVNSTNPLHTYSGIYDVVVVKLSDAPPAPVVVPTMAEWGMIILTVLLGIGAVYYLGKRRLTV